MAYPTNPNDPYRADPNYEEVRRAVQRDNELQPDPELAEGRLGTGRIAVYALGVAILLGVVFYSLNSSTVNNAGTTPPAQTAQTPPAPAGMRDVTPRANTTPGVTTGTSSANRPTPPEADRSAAPAAGQNGNPPATKNNDQR